MARTLKERIEYVAGALGNVYRGIVLAKAILSVFSHEYEEQEAKIRDHLDNARDNIGMAEAGLLALAALIEDKQATGD